MTRLGILGAAALVASALATPAMAQEVVTNPGYCAQFYPNANCQNKGPGNPYTGSTGYWQQGYRGTVASTDGPACAQYRSYDPAAGTYMGRNGRRVACR